jgi:DNA repair protein RecN (Recombination protein N)
MLIELRIYDFAIIDKLSLKFAAGFNVITGETGAGKSILIDAVDFALGGRSDAGFIRAGAKQALVELRFQVPPMLRSEIRSVLDANEIDAGSLEYVTLTRELRDSGRSAGKINDITCKLSVYREVGGLLLDIHGQTEHLSLLRPRTHLFLLDSYADLEEPREALAELVRKLRAVRQTIDSLHQNERQREQRIEMLRYQIEEIEAARLVDGEEVELREQRNRLANAEKLATLADEAYDALYGEDELGKSGIDALNRAAFALAKLADLDTSFEEDSNLAQELTAQAEALADSVRIYRDKLDISPDDLDAIEERLEVITRLKRKYGESVKAILEFAQHAREELENIELGEVRLAELHQEEDKLLRSIGDLGKNLSNGRRRFGKKLAAMIEEQLGELKMEGARFQVSVTQEEDPDGCYVGDERLAFDHTGLDTVEFLLSANPGEPLKPLVQVASGGETARIMLALKTVLTTADRTPTLIFDEIDQGIGGRLGLVVGEKLWGLSNRHQVLCVTHLPQIAGFADTHFRVTKQTSGKRTTTSIMTLEGEERLKEMAAMLGSESETSLQNAQEIFESAQAIKAQNANSNKQPTLL